MDDKNDGAPRRHETLTEDTRAPYQRPQIAKKRSVARVTLFSGSGAAGASGLTSA